MDAINKQRVAVIFGGQSSEHEVSCMSVLNVIRQLDRARYELCLIGITKEGRWLYVPSEAQIEDGSWPGSECAAYLLPDASAKSVCLWENGAGRMLKIDLVFPVLHGRFGEDGTLQGLLELAGLPYVGCGVLASAVSMDKIYTKQLVDGPLRSIGVRQAKWVSALAEELADMTALVERIEAALPYPVFVKPSNAGSSCGVSRADDREALVRALHLAAEYDRKLLIEERIIGREIESAVLKFGEGETEVSGLGEILAAAEFYDYDAKYNNPASRTSTSPEMPEAVREQIREAARVVFDAVDGYGLARVDFFLSEDGPVFNEINTLPGFTAISMYPMLWEAAGVPKAALIQRLLDSAVQRPGQR